MNKLKKSLLIVLGLTVLAGTVELIAQKV